MQIKLGKIISEDFTNSLNNLCNLRTIPGPTMFTIRGIRKKIAEETTKYNEIRAEYINEYGQKDNDGNLIYVSENIVKLKDSKSCNAKIKELEETLIEIKEISFADLGANPVLSPNDLFNLEFITE